MNDTALRHHLTDLLDWRDAHPDPETALAEFPVALCAAEIPGSPHTPWRLLEHMRIAQWDILEFSRNAKHVSPAFPDGYWPEPGAKGTPEDWARSVKGFLSDLREMQKLVRDPRTDLFAEIPHGSGQTILREALLTADHNTYHLGQLMFMRRVLEAAAG